MSSEICKEESSFDLYVGMIGDITALNSPGEEELYLPVTGFQCLLIVFNIHDQSDNEDFEFREGRCATFFVLLRWSGATC